MCFHYCEFSLSPIEGVLFHTEQNGERRQRAKGNPSNPAWTWENVIFFQSSTLCSDSQNCFLCSQQQAACSPALASKSVCSWSKSNCGFSSVEIPRTHFLRLILCTGTVYYLNNLQMPTHPSLLQWHNYISTCSQDVWDTCVARELDKDKLSPNILQLALLISSLRHWQALPFNNIFTLWCCEDPLACN